MKVTKVSNRERIAQLEADVAMLCAAVRALEAQSLQGGLRITYLPLDFTVTTGSVTSTVGFPARWAMMETSPRESLDI